MAAAYARKHRRNLRAARAFVYLGSAARKREALDVSEQGDSAQPSPAGRTRYRPRNKRNILCVFPAYAPSFGTFQHAYRLFPDVSAFMPPQGLLLIAAYLPA